MSNGPAHTQGFALLEFSPKSNLSTQGLVIPAAAIGFSTPTQPTPPIVALSLLPVLGRAPVVLPSAAALSGYPVLGRSLWMGSIAAPVKVDELVYGCRDHESRVGT